MARLNFIVITSLNCAFTSRLENETSIDNTYSLAHSQPFEFPFTIRSLQPNLGVGDANSTAFLSLSASTKRVIRLDTCLPPDPASPIHPTPTIKVDVAVSNGTGALNDFEIPLVDVEVRDTNAVAST